MATSSKKIIKLLDVQDKLVKERLVSLELHINNTHYPKFLKYFLVEAHVSEAYLIRSLMPFVEVVLVMSESQIEEENLQKLESEGIRITNNLPSEIGIYYFPDNELYKKYDNQTCDYAIIITKSKGLKLEVLTNIINRVKKLCSFIKITGEALEREDHIVFHYLHEKMLDNIFRNHLENALSDLSDLTEKANYSESKNNSHIMHHLEKINLQLENINISAIHFNWSVFNDIYYKILLQPKQETISMFIKIINIVYSKIVQELCADTNPESLIVKLNSLKSITRDYGIMPMLYDYIANPHLSDLILNAMYEISQGYSTGITSLCRQRGGIRLININNCPQLFQFIKEALSAHIDLLLSDASQ